MFTSRDSSSRQTDHTDASRRDAPECELPDIELARSLEIAGIHWELRLSRLCPKRAISVRLNGDFYCDCHDLSARPLSYRLHMYPGATKGTDVAFAVKRQRMTSWQDAILAFNRLMSAAVDTTSMNALADALNRTELPLADLAVLDTGNPSLRRLFTALGFVADPSPPQPFVVRWSELVAAAQEGTLVSQWLSQRGPA